MLGSRQYYPVIITNNCYHFGIFTSMFFIYLKTNCVSIHMPIYSWKKINLFESSWEIRILQTSKSSLYIESKSITSSLFLENHWKSTKKIQSKNIIPILLITISSYYYHDDRIIPKCQEPSWCTSDQRWMGSLLWKNEWLLFQRRIPHTYADLQPKKLVL